MRTATIKACICTVSFVISALQLRAQETERLARLVDSMYAARPGMIGFLIHVEAPGRNISWSYAKGVSDTAARQLLSADRPVLVASNTKTFVAATILRLAEQGKIQVDQPVEKLLSPATAKLLSEAGYEPGRITLRQLMSHTSGIRDYVNEDYFRLIGKHRDHAWTRNEQIERAMQSGKPLAGPGETFKYADINYVLLTEVIETCTKKPFYEAMRALLGYRKLRLRDTWFVKLEKKPRRTAPLSHQYWSNFGWDTYQLDPSWDLYGGGGIASTVGDLAKFYQALFEGRIVRDPEILALMYEDVPAHTEVSYCLGIRKLEVAGMTGYNHGGGLGTDVVYIPELNATIAIAAIEASRRTQGIEIGREIAAMLRRDSR